MPCLYATLESAQGREPSVRFRRVSANNVGKVDQWGFHGMYVVTLALSPRFLRAAFQVLSQSVKMDMRSGYIQKAQDCNLAQRRTSISEL
jgi:hypothetical protein